MGAWEDFMAMRRAAALCQGAHGAQHRLLTKASKSELSFIRLAKAGIQEELIDLAYAVLGESRPGGPAVGEES